VRLWFLSVTGRGELLDVITFNLISFFLCRHIDKLKIAGIVL
jgi:hypothetical protein